MSKRNVEIIHSGDGFIVVNKPAGISVTADRSGAADLLEVLGKQTGIVGLRLVHRLDKYASGVMLIAKSRAVQSEFSKCFAKRTVKKTYLALVSGYVSDSKGVIDLPISRSRRDPRLMRVDRRSGKEAVTRWRLLADFGGAALLAVEPETGRTHQIRVHMACKDMPLAVDGLYGSGSPLMLSDFKAGYRLKAGREEASLIDRLTLHAYELDVPGDHGGVWRGRLDKKFSAAIKMLAKHGPTGREAFVNEGHPEAILAGEAL